MGTFRAVIGSTRARMFSAAAVFIIILLFAGPQPSSPRHEREPRPARRAVGSRLEPPAPPRSPLPRPWREAVRAGIASPRKTKHVDPIYPESARQERIEGVVILEILIDEGGTVEDARVLRSIGLLDQAAIDAVRQWRFTPSLIEDRPVKVVLTVNVEFAIQG